MMAGSVLGAGVTAVIAVLVLGAAAIGGAAAEGQRAAGMADAAALAAADAASGSIGGEPCERAEEVVRVSRGSVTSCTVEGLIATVTVNSEYGGLPVSAAARAGPPPS